MDGWERRIERGGGMEREGRREGAGSTVNLSLWAGSLSPPARRDND